jgi:serine/threonine protein kinase
LIGYGATSSVFLVNDPNGIRKFAIKRFPAKLHQPTFMNEIETLVKLNHPCIVKIFGYALPTQLEEAEIHMEFAPNGSLADILKRVRRGEGLSFWNSTGIGIIISGIVLGMRYMHARGFIHQDLKPSNILLSDKERVLISDFGSSRPESPDVTPTAAVTPRYAAPELFHDDVKWTSKVDVYSFGLILYEVLIGSPVFPEDQSPFEIIRLHRSGYMPDIDDKVLPSMKSLIQTCLQSDPSARPSFDDILKTFEQSQFDFVQGADIERVYGYVDGVRDWELSHPPHQLILDPGSSGHSSMSLRNVV